MTQPTIRSARASDAAALQTIYVLAARSIAADRAFLDAAPERLDLSRKVVEGDRILVADTAGQPIGFAVLSPEGEIRGLFVDPGFHRRGLGRMLADACEGDARGMDAETLTVVSHPAAEGFWTSLGFVPAGEAETEGGPALRLVKPLRISAA